MAGRRTVNDIIYIPDHAQEDWDELDQFDGSLDGIDALFGSNFFLDIPLPPASSLTWLVTGLKRGYVWPVDESAITPSGSEVGNDGWRVLIRGTGIGPFLGHSQEIAVWDDTGSSWSFQAVNQDGNWTFDTNDEKSYYYKYGEWNTPSGITAFDAAGTESIAAPDSGVKTVAFVTVQPDTNYRILLTGDTIGSHCCKNKTVNGFEIHAQTSGWVGDVDWALTRKDDTGLDDRSETETIVAGGTVTVSFPIPYPDTNYRILLTPSMTTALYYKNKTANGFEIHASSSVVTGDVDWCTKYGT